MTAGAPTLRFAYARLPTGVRLHYTEQGPAGGEALVLLHGWPDSWFTFSRVLPLLPPAWRVIAPDQRGYGDSERPASGYAIDAMAADVVAVLDHVGVDRATLAGHSYGSFVARSVAALHPERVARLVLIGTGLSPSNPVTRDVQASLRDVPDPVPPEFAREFQAGTAHMPLPPEFFEQVIVESLKIPAPIWRTLFDRLLEHDDAARLGAIAAPTLLLWGDHDALFPREDQDRLVSLIPRARLKVYAETGHCPNWERPERLAEDLVAFQRET